ncbi:MAG: anti-sigma factor, partial [Actinobacteria bacterium]|nr:anti-sigma factor [Actinomycetota bacterium]
SQGGDGMNEELPERLRSMLGSEAVWLEPSPEVEEEIRSLATTRARGGAAKKVRMWLPVTVSLAILLVGAALTFDRPDWQTELVATSEAPGASALVSGWNDDEGTRLRFEIDGLPETPADSYYEIWLTSDEGLHVSGGSFNGNGVLTAMVGVRRGDFPRIWITLEPIDEESYPSLDTVLDSKLEA